MTRKRWWLTWSVLLALGGAAWAAEGPCKPPPAPDDPCGVVKDRAGYVSKDKSVEITRRIEEKLVTPFNLHFKDTPLKQVIEDLHNLTGVNVVADIAALEESGVSLEQPLSLQVEDMALKSALNILLKQARLTYIIKDEALQITTEESARGKLPTVTYPNSLCGSEPRSCGQATSKKMPTVTYLVADLILPLGSGESELPPFLWRMTKDPGTRVAGQSCEDLLIRQITNTVAPDSWAEAGGAGTIQYFPLGLAIVVSQNRDVQEQVAEYLAELRRLQQREDRQYVLETKVYEVNRAGQAQAQVWPRVTLVRGQQIQLSIGGAFSVGDRTLEDLMPSGMRATTLGASHDLGTMLRVKVTAADGEQLRLDANYLVNETAEATPDGVLIAGQAINLRHLVQSGQPVKFVISRDDTGRPRKWLEMTITELPDEPEDINLESTAPIDR